MNVSGGRLLLFVTQLTDGPHITFSILDVALNNCLYYIIAYLITCVILPRGCVNPPRIRGGLAHCGWAKTMSYYVNTVIVLGVFKLLTNM